jgi:hypothetical protein
MPRLLDRRRSSLGHLVGVTTDELDLRIDHLVHADEVRPDDVSRRTRVLAPAISRADQEWPDGLRTGDSTPAR